MFTSKKSLFSKLILKFLSQPSKRTLLVLVGCAFYLYSYGENDSLRKNQLGVYLRSPLIFSKINSKDIQSRQKFSLTPEIVFSLKPLEVNNQKVGIDFSAGAETYKFNINPDESKNNIIHKMNLYFFSMGISYYLPLRKNHLFIISIKNYLIKPYKYSVIDKGSSTYISNKLTELDKDFSMFYVPRICINSIHNFKRNNKNFISLGLECNLINQAFSFNVIDNSNSTEYKNKYFVLLPFIGIRRIL